MCTSDYISEEHYIMFRVSHLNNFFCFLRGPLLSPSVSTRKTKEVVSVAVLIVIMYFKIKMG